MPLLARERHFPLSQVELTDADVGDVARLYARCADYFLLQDGEAPTFADARELFSGVPPEKIPEDQTVFGWKDAEALYAVAAILRDYPVSGTWYLGLVIVDPERRGHEIGRSIYFTIEDWVASRGADEIRLAVLEQNEAGARFWRSLGFKEVRRVGPDRFKTRSHHRMELSRCLNSNLANASAR